MKSLELLEKSGKIPHALLFVGSQSSGLEDIAYGFASRLLMKEVPGAQQKLENRNHPDIHVYQPEGRTGMHSMESLKRLVDEVGFRCYEAPMKFVLMKDAERCLPTSSNALLKTLEEPHSHSILILMTTKPEKLLPTIVSRCQKLVFDQGRKQQNPYQERFLEMLMGGCHKEALEALTVELEKERKEWEKKLMKELPKELPLLQRERMEKEIEGASALEYQEKGFSLFETLLNLSRDVTLHHMGIPKGYFHFKEPSEKFVQMRLPYESVEKAILQMKVAFERGSSLYSCLEALLFHFSLM